MFYYVDPHLYKTKYATTSIPISRPDFPGRITVGTTFFLSPFFMKAFNAGTQASLKPVHFMTPLTFAFARRLPLPGRTAVGTIP